MPKSAAVVTSIKASRTRGDMHLKLAKSKDRLQNITTVLANIPSHLRRRVKSGIEEFDAVIGGEGFVPSQVIMVTGSPGAGKSTIALQLLDGLTAAGHLCLYNGAEESVHQTALAAERLGVKHGFVVGNDVMLKDVLDHARQLQATAPNKQLFLVVDSLQTLEDGSTNGTAKMVVNVTNRLVEFAKETHAIVFFICHSTKAGDFAGRNTIRHAIDTHLRLFTETRRKDENFGCKKLEASKNRMGSCRVGFLYTLTKQGLRFDAPYEI